MLDSRPKGRGFEPHRRHCVVSLSKNINPSLVLVQPRKTRPFISERLLMGRKESNQIKKRMSTGTCPGMPHPIHFIKGFISRKQFRSPLLNHIYEPRHEIQHCSMCDQQSLGSACAYKQSDQSLCYSLEYSISVKLLTEHHLEFLSLREAAHARLSLHLSKCHIVGNLMPRLIFVLLMIRRIQLH